MKYLEKLFSDLSLNWIDDNRNNVLESEICNEFVKLFPKIKDILQVSIKRDKAESERTLRHTFRLLKVYYQLKNDEFKHKSLNSNSIDNIKGLIGKMDQKNLLYLPLILIFHDIGRPFNRKLHTYESAKIVKKWNLLDDYGLNRQEIMLIIKVIEYHLLLGTIYTGESTYYAFNTLFNDEEFVEFLENKEFVKDFMLLSSTFTILDPFGYFYAQIFDHYIEKYSEIQHTISEILLNWPNINLIKKKLRKVCFDRLDWRLACSLRIFQLIGTKPQLTHNFFVEKIKDSVKIFLNKTINEKNWLEFKQTYLSENYLIQLKYALPILMVLASGEFKRIFRPKTVNTNLIHFWINLNQKIKKENEKSKFKNENWNVIFEGIPHWSLLKDSFSQFLDKELLKTVIENAEVKLDHVRKENWLLLKFDFQI
ncbi:MAG: HD domain-containing protein [Candidatus Helarchaeota archaeon]|nr:HD domain-containing protein [Candidatus Helarchaeota archaeon]